MREKTFKGQISVIDKDSWVQLRWRHQGKRYYLSPGLPYDDGPNVQVANRLAGRISLDIISGNFDTTLEKYQSSGEVACDRSLGAAALFEKFIRHKSKRVQPRTLEKYRALVIWLKEFYQERPATDKDADGFMEWLLGNMEASTAKERLGLLKSCWNWGIKERLVSRNPWEELQVKKQPKQKPRPFSQDEVQAILQGFKEHPSYRHYYYYLRFKFATGCRTEEASGLRWRHLNDDCTVVWIGEAYTHGQFKEVKRNKAREVKLSPATVTMLRSLRPISVDPDALVFPAPKGGPIDEHNFSQRAWKKVLNAAGVTHRRPYCTRHTFVSHALESGLTPAAVAAITGHSVKVLYEDYAGYIKSTPEAPDLFE